MGQCYCVATKKSMITCFGPCDLINMTLWQCKSAYVRGKELLNQLFLTRHVVFTHILVRNPTKYLISWGLERKYILNYLKLYLIYSFFSTQINMWLIDYLRFYVPLKNFSLKVIWSEVEHLYFLRTGIKPTNFVYCIIKKNIENPIQTFV
jgi:hypothetical protein